MSLIEELLAVCWSCWDFDMIGSTLSDWRWTVYKSLSPRFVQVEAEYIPLHCIATALVLPRKHFLVTHVPNECLEVYIVFNACPHYSSW